MFRLNGTFALPSTEAYACQALMLIAPTIGFPNVIAALSWAEDVLGAKD